MKCLKDYLVHGLITGSLNSNVDHGVLQGPAHIKFQGKVIHTLKFKREIFLNYFKEPVLFISFDLDYVLYRKSTLYSPQYFL